MKITLPALEMSGWETDPQSTGIKIFSYILQSEVWQSSIYEGNITSIQGIIIDNQSNSAETASALKQGIESIFDKYFDSTTVEVNVPEDSPESRYELTIDVTYTRDDVSYSLGAAIFINSTNNGATKTIEAIRYM